MAYLLCYELVSDKKLWAVAHGPSIDELKTHIEKYAMGTTFTVYKVAEDFDFTVRLNPPVGDSEPVFTWCDGGSPDNKAFLESAVEFGDGNAKAEFTLACEGLPKGTDPLVGLFDDKGGFVGRTEVVNNATSPVFQKNFIVRGDPRGSLDLKFSVYNSKGGITADTFIGCASLAFKGLLKAGATAALKDNAGADTGAQLMLVKKVREKKTPQPQQKKKDKKKEKKEAPAPSSDEKKKKASLKEGGKKGQDISGLHDMGGVSFFHIGVEKAEGDMGLLEATLAGFNKVVDEDADDRKGGAGGLGKMLFSYDDTKLIFLAHVPDCQLEKVDPKEWVAKMAEGANNGEPTILESTANIIKGSIAADPDNGKYPIKMRDAAITKCYNWLIEKKLVIPDDDSDDDIVYGDDDFPDYDTDEEEEVKAEPTKEEPTKEEPTKEEPEAVVATKVFEGVDEGKCNGMAEFLTYDTDACLGKPCPDLSSLQYLNEEAHAKAKAGQVTAVLVWGQYHKPGYKYIALYTTLQKKYGDKLRVVGVSVDPDTSYPVKFITDPAKKYSTVFPCDYAMAWDDGKIKKALMEAGNFATMSPPHCFVVDTEGTIVWHQDHSELGATVPSYMGLMEDQIDALLAGSPLKKVGDRPEVVYSDEDGDDEPAADVDLDDLF